MCRYTATYMYDSYDILKMFRAAAPAAAQQLVIAYPLDLSQLDDVVK